jgi:hypothetical protein
VRRLTGRLVALLIVVGVAATAAPAWVSCAGSHVGVQAIGGVGEIAVTWSVEPVCDVVESGLLVGRDPASLLRSTATVHRAAATYAAVLPVTDTGVYWIAAYARDEDGNILASEPTFTVAMALTDHLAHGSHGAPPSYSGTDADFLQIAGEPHFASLRRLDLTDAISNQNGNSLTAARVAASTSRSEVETTSLAPMPLGLPTNPAQVATSLGSLDQQYVPPFFPRPGLYAVSCLGQGNAFSGQTTCRAPVSGFPAQLGLSLARTENVVVQAGFFTIRNTRSAASSASFFVPKAGPGVRVKTAQFTASFFSQSTPDAAPRPRLNGRTPVATAMNCGPFFAGFPEGVNCNGVATWDFTDDVRALAAADGGLFVVTPDLMPAFHIVQPLPSGATQTIDVAHLSVVVAANYPWRHGTVTSNALTISYEASCARELTVTPMPDSVRPLMPQGTTTEAQIRADVKTCPPGGSSPLTVLVRFRVDAARPTPGSADGGGHVHDGNRPHGTLAASSCLVNLAADGTGSCGVAYRPSEVGGVETVIAEADGFDAAEARVKVEVAGLVDLAAIRTNFFRLTGQTSTHPDNHWGTPETITNVQLIALDYFTLFEATLGINDISLRQGGMFDICATWNPAGTCSNAPGGGHVSHRVGKGVDIDRIACRGLLPDTPGPTCTSGTIAVPRQLVQQLCFAHGRATMARESTYHCEFPR